MGEHAKEKTEDIKKPHVRDVRFDGLRVIGLLAIILAHIYPPAVVYQLRNFDVPLMILVSGSVYGLSSSANKKYLSYIWGRVMRLVAPTWVFLSIFFLFFSYSREEIISSYALVDGIGYVWIIRVFILVAFISPLFIYLYRKIHNKKKYLLLLALIYTSYEALYFLYPSMSLIKNIAPLDFIVQNILFYMVPFGCIAGFGLYLTKASNKALVYFSAGFFILFLCLCFMYDPKHFIPTQGYKYPPRIYYLSYALSVSLLLYVIGKTSLFAKIFSTKIMLFMASSTLWIYLWHIFFLFQWDTVKLYVHPYLNNFIFIYIFVLTLAMLVTYLQKRIIKKLAHAIKHKTWRMIVEVAVLK